MGPFTRMHSGGSVTAVTREQSPWSFTSPKGWGSYLTRKSPVEKVTLGGVVSPVEGHTCSK